MTTAMTSMSVAHPDHNSRGLLIIGGLAALLCAQLLYGALVLSALYKQYREPALAVQALACEELARSLSRMARLGREPDRMPRLQTNITAQGAALGVESLLVLDAAGKPVASWGVSSDTVLSLPKSTKPVQGQVQEFSAQDTIWLTQPILNHEGRIVGHVLVGMDEDTLAQKLRDAASGNVVLFVGVTLGACVLLVVLCLTVAVPCGRSGSLSFPRTRLYVSLVLPLALAQLIFAFSLREPLRALQHANMQEVAGQLGGQLGRDLEHIIGLGLSLHQVPAIQEHLISIQKSLLWTQGIGIYEDDRILFAAAHNGSLSADAWIAHSATALAERVPVHNPRTTRTVATVHVLLSPDAVEQNIQAITLDTLTMTVIAMLFLVELLALLMLKEERLRLHDPRPLSASAGFMRPVIFICMFANTLSISFIPLRMAEITPVLFGLPPDVIMGLPVSCEMFMVGLAIMIGGFWSQKAGWRPLFVWGALLVTLGNLASGLVDTPLLYIVARGCAGSGYGLINLAAQVFVVAHATPENRATSLASMVAGLYAGLLCGSAFGGLIADRFGYAAVFVAAAVFMGIIGTGLSLLLPREPWKMTAAPQRLTTRDLLAFMTDQRMAGLLFLNIVPCAFVTVCLFQFYIPVSLNQGGASPASIGRVSMLLCLVVIYLGPVFGRAVDRSTRKIYWLTGAGLCGACSVAALLVLDGLWAAIVCVLLLGLCNAIIFNAQGAYALELPATLRLGAPRTMGIYNVMERIGQVLGPVSLGLIITLWGSHSGLTLMAVIFAAMSLLLALTGILHPPGSSFHEDPA